jgi:hypothetical protein
MFVHFPNSHWAPNPQSDGIWRWLGYGQEGKASVRIMSHQRHKNLLALFLTLCLSTRWGQNEKVALYKWGRKPSAGLDYAGASVSDF